MQRLKSCPHKPVSVTSTSRLYSYTLRGSPCSLGLSSLLARFVHSGLRSSLLISLLGYFFHSGLRSSLLISLLGWLLWTALTTVLIDVERRTLSNRNRVKAEGVCELLQIVDTFLRFSAPHMTASSVNQIVTTEAGGAVVDVIQFYPCFPLRRWHAGSLGHCMSFTQLKSAEE